MACAFSSSIHAADLDYTYVEGRYIFNGELEDVDDFDGFRIGGSFKINDDFFAYGSYESDDFDKLDGDYNFTSNLQPALRPTCSVATKRSPPA
jgi:hypothetical protein